MPTESSRHRPAWHKSCWQHQAHLLGRLFLPHLAVSVAAFLCRREPTMRFSADQRRALAKLSIAGRDGVAQALLSADGFDAMIRWSRQSWVGDAHQSKGAGQWKGDRGGDRKHHGSPTPGSRRRRLRIGRSHRVRVPGNSAEAMYRRCGHCSTAQQWMANFCARDLTAGRAHYDANSVGGVD